MEITLNRLVIVAAVVGATLTGATTAAQAAAVNPARLAPAAADCFAYVSGGTTFGGCAIGGGQFRLHFGCTTSNAGVAGFTNWQNAPGATQAACGSGQTADPGAAYIQTR
jgi:hypothetical protein